MARISKKYLFILIICLLASLFLRFVALEMDNLPYFYGPGWCDEGAYAHNARNMVLFGEWKIDGDKWNPMYISPVFNQLLFLSFKFLGVSIFSDRLLMALLGFISLVLASILLFYKRYEEGLFFFIFSSINIMLIAFGRIGMLEGVLIFFTTIIIALIAFNSSFSWFVAGVLLPFLFFSKVTSISFIFACLFSPLLYYFYYKDKNYLIRFRYLFFGLLLASILWSFWLVPNLNDWIFMNFKSYSSRIYFTIFKPFAVPLAILQFSVLLNPVISALSLFYIVFIVKDLINKKKIPHYEFFFLLLIFLFLGQTILTDYPMRRFVLVLPALILFSTRFLEQLKELNLSFNDHQIKIKRESFIASILVIYILINFTHAGLHFQDLKPGNPGAFTILKNSEEVGKLIPANEKVYGNYANDLSLESKIIPYFSYNNINYANKEEDMLPMLENKEINYAILEVNLFSQEDLILNNVNLELSPSYKHIKENFYVLKELNSKDIITNSPYKKYYIYKRNGYVSKAEI